MDICLSNLNITNHKEFAIHSPLYLFFGLKKEKIAKCRKKRLRNTAMLQTTIRVFMHVFKKKIVCVFGCSRFN